MFKTIAIVVVVAIAAVLIYAATRPDDFRVQRVAVIKAPPEKIFPLINDIHSWAQWSPYEKLDPDMKRTHSGAPSGKGAVYEWDGNKNAGAGRMEIIESSPSTKVAFKLDFMRPFEGHNTAEFTLQAQGDATQVTWSMFGPSAFITKLMGLFFDMDNLIGKDFAAGLATLKTVAEK